MASMWKSLTGSSGGSTSTMRTESLTVLRETTVEAKSTTSRAFGSSMDEHFKNILTIDNFLDYIAAERLRRMPHRGSKWDRVLAYAAFFASQTQRFSVATGDFVSHSQDATRLIWTNLQLLLDMGPEYVDILERIFVVYYDLGITLSSLVYYEEHFMSSSEVQQSLSIIFSNTVRLVAGMAAQFGQSRRSSSMVISSEIHRAYGSLIESTHARRDQIFNYLWATLIKSENIESYTIDIETIRTFLSPSDRTVKALTSSPIGSKGFRAEHTCEWFQKHLMDFTRSQDNVFLVQGKAGTGKSFLGGWIAERLQRAEGKKAHYDVISFSVEKDICTQTSQLAVAKGLLLQLLDWNIGNTKFYRVVCDVIEASAHAKSAQEIEQSLWRAIDAGLHPLGQPVNTMFLIDGLDQLDGGEATGLNLLERLHYLGKTHGHVKAIVLSQPLSKAAPSQTRSLTIEATHTTQDIRHHVQEVLYSSSSFRQLKITDRERIVQRVSTSAEGSFVWADFSLEILRREKTVSGIVQGLDSLPKTLNDALKKLHSLVDLKAADTRSLLAWLLAAQRPLTLDELKVFFEIDLGSCSHKPRFSEIEQDIIQAVGPLVVIRNGIVRFKHDTIRTYFVNLAGSVKDYSNTGEFPFMMKEAHYDLSTRCLAYVKLFVTRRMTPIFGRIPMDVLNDVYEQYSSFEYCATYWMSHFNHSPMYDPKGQHKLVPEFRTCFPDSVLLSLIEGSVWQTYNTVDYKLALYIRQTILGQESVSVLQTLINYARTLELIKEYKEATTHYYRAYTLAETLFGEESEVVIKIAIAYLTCSSTVTITERTEIAIQRETLLKRIIAVYKETYGVSHSLTIRYLRTLAQLYVDTKQYDHAAETWIEVYEIYVQTYGEFHSETKTVYKTVETVIEKSSRKEEFKKRITRTSETTTSREIVTTEEHSSLSVFEMIEYYEKRQEYTKAESILVEHWRSICESAATSRDTTIQKRKFEVTNFYSRFLRRHERHEEARTIMEVVATEFFESKEEIRSESVATSINEFAQEMRELKMVKTARSMFSSVSSYFQKIGKTSSTVATSATRSMEETTEEIIQTSTRSTTSTTTSTTSSSSSSAATDESTLREVFQSLTSMTSSTSSVKYASIIKSSQQLSVFYQRQQRWTECFQICSEALSTMWQYFITRQGTVRLPDEYRKEVVELALRMGECTWAQRQFEKTEDIYFTIFKATRSTVKVTDELFSLVAQTLTDFYEQTFQIQKYLKIKGEIYSEQKTQLGATNTVTIKTAYSIAQYCWHEGKYRDAEHYFVDIYSVLVTGDFVTVDAIKAAEYLLIIYDSDARWDAAEKLCAKLWHTFVTRGSESRLHVDLVEKTYRTYLYILQEVRQVKFTEIYKLTKTYKETCEKVFGERNELTLKASLQFAQICERSEEHRKESLAVYEEVCKRSASSSSSSSSSSTSTSTTTTTTSTAVLQTLSIARQSLSRIYTKESSTSETATRYVNEEYESKVSQYGQTDSRSLTSLSQLVEYNHKEKKTETTQKSVRMLQSAVVETIKKETSTQTLIKSASILAESYTKIEQKETAWELLREVRRQVVTGNYKSSSKFNFSLEGAGRRAYTFIIAFSQILKGESATSHFSEYMAELQQETLLYQSYSRAVTQKSSFEVIFTQGCRLSVFYKVRKRQEDYNWIWNELIELFAVHMGASKQSVALKEFFELIMTEIEHNHYDTITQLSVERILTKMKESKFQEAYELATYVDKLTQLHGGWRSQSKVEDGFLVCLHLMGRSNTPKPTDTKVLQQLVEISRKILSEVLAAARDLNVRFIQMPMKQINDIVAILSEQENFTDLEWLLSELYNSRHTQTSWDSITIVSIGRRLVEVRFATGHRESAIHLCEDITYNVRRVWGASDTVTVQMWNLLASLHGAAGHHYRAIQVHEDVLRQILISYDEEGDIDSDQGAEIAKDQLELMKRSVQRNGGWADKDFSAYKDLYAQLQSSFGQSKAFASTTSVEKWSTKEKAADNYGIWTQPSTFEFAGGREQRHKNHLRWSSGLVWGSPKAKKIYQTFQSYTQPQQVNGS